MADARVPPDLSLEQVLAEAILADRQSWPKAMKIWPSDLGVALGPEHDGCQAAFWHRCRDAEQKEISPGQLLMFKVGDLIHEYMVEMLRKHLPAHGWEVVDDEGRAEAFGISGRFDVKIRHIETGWTRVVDFKTKRGNAFQYLNEPKPGNVIQDQFYIAAEDADDGSLLYIDREGQNFVREFLVERADHRPATAVKVLEEIRDAEEPPPPVELTLKRVRNKGPDSIYLNVPWQITWCSLKHCPCAAALPGSVPDKIVAKVSNDGMVTPQEGYEKWLGLVLDMLVAQFPGEKFYVDGTLFQEEVSDA